MRKFGMIHPPPTTDRPDKKRALAGRMARFGRVAVSLSPSAIGQLRHGRGRSGRVDNESFD